MHGYLRQSTAATVLLGKFVDATDGNTAETGLSIAASDVLLSKGGGTPTAKAEATAPAHLAAGYYSCALGAADTDTIGRLTVACQVAGALYVERTFAVLSAAMYDWLFGATAPLTDKAGYSLATPPPTASDVAAAILVNPDNKLATDLDGAADASVVKYRGSAVPAAVVAGVPVVDVGYVGGQAAEVADGTAQGGGANTITLDADTAPTIDDAINGLTIRLLANTGAGQWNVVTDYDATTKVATLRDAWAVEPDDTTTYVLGDPAGTGATAVDVRTEMDNNSTRLANLDAAVSSRSTYAGDDTAGTTTLLSRLTGTRAGNLDNLDAKVSERLATTDYASPPSAATIADAMLDRVDGVESGETVRQFFRKARSILMGVATTAGGVSVFKRKDGTTTSLTVTHDGSGNRSEVSEGVN